MASLTRERLSEYGDLAIDTLLSLSEIFDATNRRNLIEAITGCRAIISLFSKTVSGQITVIHAKERMQTIVTYITLDNSEQNP